MLFVTQRHSLRILLCFVFASEGYTDVDIALLRAKAFDFTQRMIPGYEFVDNTL